jgi:hypothetical protein
MIIIPTDLRVVNCSSSLLWESLAAGQFGRARALLEDAPD